MCVYNVRPLTLTRIPENPKKKNGEANYLYFHPRGVNRVPTTIAQRPLDGVWSVERNRHPPSPRPRLLSLLHTPDTILTLNPVRPLLFKDKNGQFDAVTPLAMLQNQ